MRLTKLVPLALAGALLLAGCTPADTADTSGAAPASAPSAVADAAGDDAGVLDAELAAAGSAKVRPGPRLNGPSALSVLGTLPVKGKAPATGYNRNAKFGNGWKDFDGDKCDERQEALSRDMSKVRFKDQKKCTLASGTLHDLYTGRTINWKVNSGSVDIDHAVALKNSWISGAQQLSQAQRQALANDPLNLISSDASSNRAKGEKNAAEWLPKNKGFRCQYVATQVSVKKKYALWVTGPEKAAMAKVLGGCKTQKAAKVTPIKPAGAAKPAPKPAPRPAAKHAGLVSPGAYCKTAQKGWKGTGKTNHKTYTCKTSATDTRLRWRI